LITYFSDPNYVLNNLGEGVYGWMTRLEKKAGSISIPDSKGQTWFLTAFVDSEINRDPTRRAAHELPDSSIVPDLYLACNCQVKCFINGKEYVVEKKGFMDPIKIEDVLLRKGINRITLVCQAEEEDIRINAWFNRKYGDPVPGITYRLTLD